MKTPQKEYSGIYARKTVNTQFFISQDVTIAITNFCLK
jgi:hypothetical protein